MAMLPGGQRLLAGPVESESLVMHAARLGALPDPNPGDLVTTLERSGLLGRGGAGFPVGRKWRALVERRSDPAVVVVNGAEGEPRSAKDRILMTYRPHLVLDGAILAAATIGADEIVVYVGEEHGGSRAAMSRAISERSTGSPATIRLVAAPIGYVSGEATAAVHHINSGDARPTTTPPRPSEVGVRGRPTLVQNVESLAYAALIARFGDGWYRALGRRETPGTALVTISGAVASAGVDEIELGTTVGELAALVGARHEEIGAILIGGYFGAWVTTRDGWDMALDPATMTARGLSFGCGMVTFHAASACGVEAAAEIIGFMAAGSAGQCGPCVHGLRAIAETAGRLAAGTAERSCLDDLQRWTRLVVGRGACRHPDGAAQFMASAMVVFADEFERHCRTGTCSATRWTAHG
ncbi:MAG: NADH-ubiquinone oxidoreductase-F iron-sulfur binding region domain-containing protein [Chloroflexota bacterium]